ncbi:hypothetical protein PDESU_02618 [Pontiella desulfatans]|uniref:DUF2264 domain-containing protein n=1 Tax=Pontiella desulfatans TaxID=2750659 RepID=A0A6C2U3C4_PONDE|nr:DUF2264 domain-containing protein [Pontiella desulfatans]VGO14061.1 hypothetical protein PDESU_02618 [Pontiella desulfatans]
MSLDLKNSETVDGLDSTWLNGNPYAFKVENPDFENSPFTGMTRRHWLDAAKFLIEGVFQHVNNIDDPIILPKQNKISYPQPDDPRHRFQAAEFEGIARTMMAAGPVIVDNPDTICNGINIRDYYANQILQATDPKSPRFWGRNSDFQKEYGRMQYQQTVEGAALAINLMATREQIWDRYSDAEKQQIADLLSDYAHSLTIGHNWRFFNVLMLTFLKVNGYAIDESTLTDHLQHLMSNYVGDGWYIDDTNYDFYNPWGFHFYGPLWCKWYGYEHAPELAAIIEKRNKEFIVNWPRFFARDGKQLMWGRSIIYRFAASTAFGAHFLTNDPVLDPGFARRIASGNMLQFLSREDLFVNGMPCLGYYGPFEPLIQFYSCAASPFWLAKCFVALSLPEDSPFWTAEENEGFWPELGDRTETVELPGPGMQVVNHGKTGTTELRTGKVKLHETYYNQLQFNPDFPLETETPGGSNAASYSIREKDMGQDFRIPLDYAFNKIEDGILYRLQNTQPVGLGDPNKGGVSRGPERIDLADIPIPSGIIRVDRVRVPYRYELQLGHFALPHLNGNAAIFEKVGAGLMASIADGRKLAMIPVHGWDSIKTEVHKGLNPEADESTVIYTERIREKDYSGMEVFVTVLLHRLDGGDWTDDELNPIQTMEVLPWAPSGTACGVKLALKDGREYLIDYGNVDGRRII